MEAIASNSELIFSCTDVPYQYWKDFYPATAKVLPKFFIRIAGFFNASISKLYEMAYQLEYSYLVNHDKCTKRFGNYASCALNIVKATVQWYLSVQNNSSEQKENTG